MLRIMLCSLFLWSAVSFANDNVNKVLDNFHQAAANANFELYFSLLAENSVFLGTDATERWNKKHFAQYVKPYFSQGKGWSYVSLKRNLTAIENMPLYIFDELLQNEYYGECRGSGVITLENGEWKILQYNLSVTVPNDISQQVVSLINGHKNN